MSLDPNQVQPPYVYQAWPAWRYDPETGEGRVFESPDEVPDGWTNIPPGTSTPDDEPVEAGAPEFVDQREEVAAEKDESGETAEELALRLAASATQPEQAPAEPVELTEEQKAEAAKAKIESLKEGYSQTDLVGMLDAMKEILPNLEYATNWPKLKLATVIVENGGPLED